MSSIAPIVVPKVSENSGGDAAKLDLWEQALATLSAEDQKHFIHPSSSMLDVLKEVCKSLSIK